MCSSKQLDRAAQAGRIRQPSVGGEQSGGANHLGEGHVGGIVCAEVMPELPHSRYEPVRWKPAQRHKGEAFQRRSPLLVGQNLLDDETSKNVGHFAVNEVWNCELFIPKTVGVKFVRDELDHDAGVNDPQSPRPSCKAARIVSRSTVPRTSAWVRSITTALVCSA